MSIQGFYELIAPGLYLLRKQCTQDCELLMENHGHKNEASLSAQCSWVIEGLREGDVHIHMLPLLVRKGILTMVQAASKGCWEDE